MTTHKSHWVKWGFTLFGMALVIINGALTFSFGFNYLGGAFGNSVLADYAGAFYALLLFDIGYIAWFFTFVRASESTGQRALSIGLSVFSLLGSLAATLQQLATNATSLVDLSGYHDAVGYVALGAMLIMTTAHVVATAAFFLLDPREDLKQFGITESAKLLDSSKKLVEAQLRRDRGVMVEEQAGNIRLMALFQMGFDNNLKLVDKAKNQLAAPDNGKSPHIITQTAAIASPSPAKLKKKTGDQFVIWWTSQEESEEIENNENHLQLPQYIQEQFRSRLGRNGRGRLWVDKSIPVESINWDKDVQMAPACSQRAGIVINADHHDLVAQLPGFCTDLNLSPIDTGESTVLNPFLSQKVGKNGNGVNHPTQQA